MCYNDSKRREEIMKKYQIIYADPPWPEAGGIMTTRCYKTKIPGEHLKCFKTMSIEEICNLPIKQIADTNCVLYLWVTARHLPFAFAVMDAWGFKYINIGFTWMKKNKNNPNPAFCTGAWTKQNVELCLFGTKGKCYHLLKSHAVNSAIYEPREEPAKKPAIIRTRIEQLFGNIPRIELFARQKTKGWDTWGNEVQCDVEI